MSSRRSWIRPPGVTPTTYNITYELDGGTNDPGNPSTFVVGDLDITLEDASKTNYTFDGWFDQASGGTEITVIDTAEDITVYAQFTAIDYTITYNLDGGTNDPLNPSTFNAEDTFPITLEPATKAGSTFDGWFDANTGGNQVTDITSSDLGSNLVLYAQWTLE